MKYFLALAAALVFAVSISAQSAAKPNFAAMAMDGTKIDTAALRGKVVVLNLWFINCMNCIEEIKALNALVDEYKDNKDVVFLGLASSPRSDIEKFLIKNPFKYQIIPDAQMIILSKFGDIDKNGEMSVAFPMHYVLDREGNVVTKAQGIKGIDAVKGELKKQFAPAR